MTKKLPGASLLSSKPCIYACNVAESDLAKATKDPDKHPLVAKVREYCSPCPRGERAWWSALRSKASYRSSR